MVRGKMKERERSGRAGVFKNWALLWRRRRHSRKSLLQEAQGSRLRELLLRDNQGGRVKKVASAGDLRMLLKKVVAEGVSSK